MRNTATIKTTITLTNPSYQVEEHLPISVCLISGICWITSQDSDPQCGHSSVQDGAHCLHRELL